MEAAPYIVSDNTRTEVWQNYWTAKRGARYYQALHRRFSRLHQLESGLMIALGSGSFVSAFSLVAMSSVSLAPWLLYLMLALGLLLAAVSMVSMVGNHAVKSAVALSIARECEEAARRFSDLMSSIDNAVTDESAARREMDRLLGNLTQSTYRSGDVGIIDNERLNIRAADGATEELNSLYDRTQVH